MNRHADSNQRALTGRRLTVRAWPVALVTAVLAVLLSMAALSPFTSDAHAATTPPNLGTAASFSVLGAETVTNTGLTTLSGDVGVSPGTAVTGFPPGIVGGTIYEGSAEAAQAQSDLGIAYDDLAGRSSTATVTGDLGGQTFEEGVYSSGEH